MAGAIPILDALTVLKYLYAARLPTPVSKVAPPLSRCPFLHLAARHTRRRLSARGAARHAAGPARTHIVGQRRRPPVLARVCGSDLSDNQLAGRIPFEFEALTALTALYAAQLPVSTGSVPPHLRVPPPLCVCVCVGSVRVINALIKPSRAPCECATRVRTCRAHEWFACGQAVCALRATTHVRRACAACARLR